MKIIQLKYDGTGNRRFFYISENNPASVNSHIYTQSEGLRNIELRYRESGIWDFDFTFKAKGKYAFIIFEDGIKKLILIVTIG